MQLGVFAIHGDGDVLPQRQVVGSAFVQQREQVGDGGGGGQFDDVAIAVEEFLKDTEIQYVDSHLSMVSMPMRLRRILRGVGLCVAGLVLALFLVVQVQQRLLRHIAEPLYSEIADVSNRIDLPQKLMGSVFP